MLEQNNLLNPERNLSKCRRQMNSKTSSEVYFLEILHPETSNSLCPTLCNSPEFSRGFLRLEDIPINKTNSQEQCEHSNISSLPDQVDQESHLQYAETAVGTPEKKNTVQILEDYCSSQFSDSSPKLDDVSTSALFETPPNKKSIVKAILEDFCASPFVESPPKADPENKSPVFHFRLKPIRTYANTRRRSVRRNIETELINVNLSDDDGSISESSELSVQEDLGQNVVPQMDTVDLKSSNRIFENLLHLCTYFSRTTSHGNIPQSSAEQMCRSRNENKLKKFLGDDDTLQDTICYDQPSLSCNLSNIEMEKAKSLIDEPINLMGYTGKMYSYEEEGIGSGSTFCDSLESPSKILHDSPVKEKKSESFPRFDPPSEGKEIDDGDVPTTSSGFLATSKIEQSRSVKYLAGYAADASDNVAGAQTANENTFLGLKTTLKEPVVVFEAENLKKSSTQRRLDQGKQEERITEVLHSVANVSYSSPTYELRRGKSIQLTNEDKKMVEKLLKDIDFFEDPFKLEENYCMTARQKSMPAFNNHSKKTYYSVTNEAQKSMERQKKSFTESHASDGEVQKSFPGSISKRLVVNKDVLATCSGFSTASKKPIAISDAANGKAHEFFAKFKQLEREKPLVGNGIQAKDNKFTGASRKPFVVSESKNLKIDKMFKKVNNEKEKQRTIEALSPVTKVSHVNSDVPSLSEPKEQKKMKSNELRNENKLNIDELLKDIDFFEDGFEEEKKYCMEPLKIKKPACKGFNIAKKKLILCIQAGQKSDNLDKPTEEELGIVEMAFEGFKTASMKPIQISEVAKQKAEDMLKEVQDDYLPPQFLKCINVGLKDKALSSQHPSEEDFGAGLRKSVKISYSANLYPEKIAEVVETNVMPNDFSKCNHADIKNCATPTTKKETRKFEGFKNAYKKNIQIPNLRRDELLMQIFGQHETPVTVTSQMSKGSDDYRKIKRKSKLGEEHLQSPKKQCNCDGLSTLKDIKKDTSQPDIKLLAKMSKNKLSLSNRKKINSLKTVCKTPKKSESLLLPWNANSTRLMRTNLFKADASNNNYSIDADFQKINWENASNSSNVYKTNSFTDLNVNSPKKGIEDVRKYRQF